MRQAFESEALKRALERSLGVEHLDVLSEVNGVRRIFERECVPSFADFDVLCLSWCEGEHMFPDKLTDEQWDAFLDDYQRLSERMQQVKTTDSVPCISDLWTASRRSSVSVSAFSDSLASSSASAR